MNEKVGRFVALRGFRPKGEESPDRIGRPAGESSDGSNLMDAVTENYRLESHQVLGLRAITDWLRARVKT